MSLLTLLFLYSSLCGSNALVLMLFTSSAHVLNALWKPKEDDAKEQERKDEAAAAQLEEVRLIEKALSKAQRFMPADEDATAPPSEPIPEPEAIDTSAAARRKREASAYSQPLSRPRNAPPGKKKTRAGKQKQPVRSAAKPKSDKEHAALARAASAKTSEPSPTSTTKSAHATAPSTSADGGVSTAAVGPRPSLAKVVKESRKYFKLNKRVSIISQLLVKLAHVSTTEHTQQIGAALSCEEQANITNNTMERVSYLYAQQRKDPLWTAHALKTVRDCADIGDSVPEDVEAMIASLQDAIADNNADNDDDSDVIVRSESLLEDVPPARLMSHTAYEAHFRACLEQRTKTHTTATQSSSGTAYCTLGHDTYHDVWDKPLWWVLGNPATDDEASILSSVSASDSSTRPLSLLLGTQVCA